MDAGARLAQWCMAHPPAISAAPTWASRWMLRPVKARELAGEPEGVAANVRLCVETGVAGLSIEDATGDPEKLDEFIDVMRSYGEIETTRSGVVAVSLDPRKLKLQPPVFTKVAIEEPVQ